MINSTILKARFEAAARKYAVNINLPNTPFAQAMLKAFIGSLLHNLTDQNAEQVRQALITPGVRVYFGKVGGSFFGRVPIAYDGENVGFPPQEFEDQVLNKYKWTRLRYGLHDSNLMFIVYLEGKPEAKLTSPDNYEIKPDATDTKDVPAASAVPLFMLGFGLIKLFK